MVDKQDEDKYIVVDEMPKVETPNDSHNAPRKVAIPKSSNHPTPIPLEILNRANSNSVNAAKQPVRSNSTNEKAPSSVKPVAMKSQKDMKSDSSKPLPKPVLRCNDEEVILQQDELREPRIPSHKDIDSLSTQNIMLLNANSNLSNKLATAEDSAAEVISLREALATATQIADTATQKLKEAEVNLRDAQAVIFRLQPFRQDITEADACGEYILLFESIQSWIDTNLGDALDDRRMMKEKLDYTSASQLISLVTPAGREAMALPDTDEYNLTAVVMRFLELEVFGKEFYGVVPGEQLKFLNSIERSMGCLEPRRDLATTRTWRSETFHALTSRPGFDTLLASRTKSLATSLTKMIRCFIPKSLPLELRSSILSTIIEPAVRLAHRLHLSPNIYSTSFSPYAKKYSESRMKLLPPIKSELHHFDATDAVQAGKSVRPTDLSDKTEVLYLLDLMPGLFLQSVKGDVLSEVKVLKKPRMVVAVVRPGDEDSFPPEFEEGEEGTLMGWLYGKVMQRQHDKEKGGLGWIMR